MKIISYLHSLTAVVLMAATVATLTACSSDDEEGGTGGTEQGGPTTLTKPQYDNESACYEITSSSSQLKSIELTGSGNYIIVKKSAYSRQAYSFSDFLAVTDEGDTRATEYGNIIQGKFTKISDTEYDLEGFGRIVITGSTGSATSLLITPEGGQAYTLTAVQKTQAPDSEKTGWLCRTWEFYAFKMKLVMSQDGKSVTVLDGKYKLTDEKKFRSDMLAGMKRAFQTFYPQEYSQMKAEADKVAEETVNSFKFDAEGRPEQIIFTKAGTYMVTYKGDRLGVATWSWNDEEKGIMNYSWDYNAAKQGTAQIGFFGNQLTIQEKGNSSSDGFNGTTELTWYMQEVK